LPVSSAHEARAPRLEALPVGWEQRCDAQGKWDGCATSSVPRTSLPLCASSTCRVPLLVLKGHCRARLLCQPRHAHDHVDRSAPRCRRQGHAGNARSCGGTDCAGACQPCKMYLACNLQRCSVQRAACPAQSYDGLRPRRFMSRL
jgi:hypothetical protein